MASLWLVTKHVPLSINGRPWLKLMLISRRLMIIYFIWSVMAFLKMATSNTEDFLCSVTVGLLNPEENYDMEEQTVDWKKWSKIDSRQHWKIIEKLHQSVHLLHDICVRKVKMLKKPKCKLEKLMQFHGKGHSSEQSLGMTQVIKLNKLQMNMNHQSKKSVKNLDFSSDK